MDLHTELHEQELWYGDGMIGQYKIDGERQPGETARFACQVQVSLPHQLISYHGYPAEQAANTGCGRGRNSVT
jgi:hypothetical protein